MTGQEKREQLAVTPVWADQPLFTIITGIKRRMLYELAAVGIVRAKKIGSSTRWNVADGLAHVEACPPAKIRLSPAQRRKLAEQERATDKSAS